MKYKFVLACMILLIACRAQSATFEFQANHLFPQRASGPVVLKDLVLSGEIKTGDAKKLLAVLVDLKSPILGDVIVNSPGGSVDEAIQIAKLVKSLYATVRVESNGYCASACFFVFLAGSPRSASAAELRGTAERRETDANLRNRGLQPTPGFVGLHRPYLTRIDSLNNGQRDAMHLVASYLEKELLSRRLIDLMMSKPSNDIYWLKEDDLTEIANFPPEREEYLIQKCGYVRNRESKIVAAYKRGDRLTAKKLVDQSSTASDCQGQVVGDAYNATMRKLKSGWLPY